MELLDLHMLAFLVFFGFMASFIDSVVGGGGLISIPALMWTGLPPVTVLGTNKCAAVMGAFTSFATFVRSGKVDVWLIKRLFPIALIGSGLGVLTVRLIPPDVLRPLVVVMLISQSMGHSPLSLLLTHSSIMAPMFHSGIGPKVSNQITFIF